MTTSSESRTVAADRPATPSGSSIEGGEFASPDLDELIGRFQERGDGAALARVMAEFDWLAVACARRLQRRGESIEDLEQVAREGLVGAVTRFDLQRGVAFKSFAWVTVVGALRHHYRTRWQVRVPRRLQEMHLTASRAIDELAAASGRSPTIDELASHTGIHREDVILALEVGHSYRVESLDNASDGHSDHVSGERVLAYVDEPLESTAARVDLHKLLASLPQTQRTALVMRYFDGKTQAEIGALLGVSQVRISRLLGAALADLRIRAEAAA